MSSLRSRLLLSYTLVIAAVLVILTVALLAVAALSTADRGVSALRQMAAINLGVRRELQSLADAGVLTNQLLGQILNDIADEQETRLLLLRPVNRQIVFDTAGGETWIGYQLSDLEIQQRFGFDSANRDVAARVRAPNGRVWLIYAPLVQDRIFGGLLLVLAQPEPSALAYFRTTFLRPLWLAGLAAFLLAVLLAWAVSRSVARPLQRLASAAEAIADGDYEQRVQLDGPAEVRTTAASFNAMASRVQATQKAQRDFVANVSHDLKTPLTSVRGWSQAMMEGLIISTEEQQQAAAIVHAEAERMSRMVSQLLDLARIESGQLSLERSPLDLKDLLSQVLHVLTPGVQAKGVALRFTAQPVPAVTGDADRLMQVFTNLLDNAVTFSPRSGEVHVSLASPDDDQVEVRVRDTGPGISADELPRVFERFYQVDKSRASVGDERGSGLGLAISKELVEAHGGRIEAQSAPGQGATFIVRLPARARLDDGI